MTFDTKLTIIVVIVFAIAAAVIIGAAITQGHRLDSVQLPMI